MTLDPSIHNVNERYSSHYLDSTFHKDIQEHSRRWREEGAGAVPRRLQREGRHYLRAKEEALDVLQAERRWRGGSHLEAWHSRLLDALGYTHREPADLPLEGDPSFVPCLGRVHRHGKFWLVICETVFCLPGGSLKENRPSENPLEMELLEEQLAGPGHTPCAGPWSRALGRMFTEEKGPRWALFLAGSQLLLLDRNTYSRGSWLRFDLDHAFGGKERSTFEQICAFLSAETLCPSGEAGEVLHERLDDRSHRFAHGVTDKLQLAVREAIELLGNEWARDRRRRGLACTRRLPGEVLPGGSTEITAEDLRHEALVFVYRLLFCLYAEARGGELGILPMEEECYRLGYSIESLRDLEQVPLTDATGEGRYFHRHLRQLFRLIHRGFHPGAHSRGSSAIQSTGSSRAFTMRPLTATLFDPQETPLLSGARLSNRCLQEVLRRLSLSVDERSRSIGRVNYADLGINQLGAVYEGLLSYRGLFADRDLIRVKPARREIRHRSTPTWFVPAGRIEEFERNQVERLEGGQPRIYPRGSFILHLNGIDREQSASYYTPEILTSCLVRETLLELLEDYGPRDADRILGLKICEPAMGSGAFLLEAAEQLAARYLELKQKELGRSIEPTDYPEELRRARHWIATRNCYGVDLNPMAVELGALSLWLGSIHRLRVARGEGGEPDRWQPGATPWFGLRLRAGNSLIGARRAVWNAGDLRRGRHAGKGREPLVPRLLGPGETRGSGEIYHFLVPDEDMAPAARASLLRGFWPGRCGEVRAWIAGQVKPAWSDDDIQAALRISELIDGHWRRHGKNRREALERTACTASVWPAPSWSAAALAPGPPLQEQARRKAELESGGGSFQRIKLIMDAWCAFWFWPLEEAGLLPSRKEWLAAAELLLGDDLPGAGAVAAWHARARAIARQEQFHHWELVFDEVLGEGAEGGGFDLVLGNPPWIKVAWTDGAMLSELDPLLGVREAMSATINARRAGILEDPEARARYAAEFGRREGAAAVLRSARLYPELAGVQTNLYKNFIVRSWQLLSPSGHAGLLHPEGIYDDARGGRLRREYYPRLKRHYQFRNQLMLFADVAHREEYSLNIFTGAPGATDFLSISHLFHPLTIESCRGHAREEEPIPGIKTGGDSWELRGHCRRIIRITAAELDLFSGLLEEPGTAACEARLPHIFSTEILQVVKKLARAPRKLMDLGEEYFSTELFHESNAQRDGVITREDHPSFRPGSPGDLVVSGPHFWIGTPFSKTPRTACPSKGAYDEIDLLEMPADYLPAAVYRPGDGRSDRSRYLERVPAWPDERGKITSRFRYCNRRRIGKGGERSLVPCILPPGPTHINTVFSVSFQSSRLLTLFASSTLSLCADLLVRITGKPDCRHDILSRQPVLDNHLAIPLTARGLRLNCLTSNYSSLWEEAAREEFRSCRWTSEDGRLWNEHELPWAEVDPARWDRRTPLRMDLSRRQALLEIDVLVAIGLSLTLEELLAIFRGQFPVLRQYELSDRYDQAGRRVPSMTRKNQGAREFRAACAGWDGRSPLTVSWQVDNGLKTVTRTYYPPFTGVDREEDYARAWDIFRKRYGG